MTQHNPSVHHSLCYSLLAQLVNVTNQEDFPSHENNHCPVDEGALITTSLIVLPQVNVTSMTTSLLSGLENPYHFSKSRFLFLLGPTSNIRPKDGLKKEFLVTVQERGQVS